MVLLSFSHGFAALARQHLVLATVLNGRLAVVCSASLVTPRAATAQARIRRGGPSQRLAPSHRELTRASATGAR
jgi:hypothetical protein